MRLGEVCGDHGKGYTCAETRYMVVVALRQTWPFVFRKMLMFY